MSTDSFVIDFEQQWTAKCQLINETTESLTLAQSSTAVVDALRVATMRLQDFNRYNETPFLEQYRDRMKNPPAEMKSIMLREKASIDTFILTLQRFKYDEPYTRDSHIVFAFKEFEQATARIPERNKTS